MSKMCDPLLLRAWVILVALSGGSAVVAALVDTGVNRSAAGAAILLLAVMKARVILSRYLGLAQSRALMSGFSTVLGFFAALLLGLYLVPMVL